MLRFLVFMLLLAAMLIAHAPAWLLARRVAADTSGWIELRDPAGTLWNGRASLFVPLPQGSAVALGGAAWRTSFDWPSRSIVAHIEQDPSAPQPVRLTGGGERTAFSGSVRLPAAAAARVPQLAGWSVGGTLFLESDSITWAGRAAEGSATIRWQNAALAPANVAEAIALGDVTVRAVASQGGVALTFANTGGSVQLSGNGDSRTGQVALQLQPRADAPPALTALLRSHLPPAPGNAGYEIRFTLPVR